MGGGKSESKTEKNTEISTTTTTDVRDIGFTGQHAVDLADILEAGSIKRAQINADTLTQLIDVTGGSFRTLAGGAGDIFQEFTTQQEGMLKASKEFLPAVVAASQGKTGDTSPLPFIALAVVGAFLVIKGVK